MGEALGLDFDCRLLLRFIAALAMSFAVPRTAMAQSPVIVTRDNFVRAQTDFYFAQTVRHGGFGKLVHARNMVPVDRQGVVRMNRDTLYSSGIFDPAAGPVTITLPDPGRRYMSLQVTSEDQYTPLVAYAPGRYTIDEAEAGTRYAMLLVRTLADPRSMDDMAAAHRLQDAIVAQQPRTGIFEVPDWDVNRRRSLTPHRRPMLTPLQRRFRLVRVANGRDPRASRSALTSDGATRVGGACLPTGASRGGTASQARFLKRQLSLPVSMMSQ
jgi:Protein of unknown function (DUF1254)